MTHISKSVQELQDLTFQGSFSSIQFGVYPSNGPVIPIATVDRSTIERAVSKVPTLPTLERILSIEYDDRPAEYKIQMYSFNVETGKGSTNVVNEKTVEKTLIHVEGKEEYRSTPFSVSLSEGKIITVSGIAKRINGSIQLITILIES